MMETPRIPVTVFLSLLMAFASGCTNAPSSQPCQTTGADIAGRRDAVAIAVAALHDQSTYPASDYTLTSAQQIVVEGKDIWRITFKPARLLPRDPSKELIGLGGEIFVNVDLSTKKTEISYGE